MMATLSSSSVVLAGDPARVKAVEEEDGDYEELIPPENFAMIEKGLYRSARVPEEEKLRFPQEVVAAQVHPDFGAGGLPLGQHGVQSHAWHQATAVRCSWQQGLPRCFCFGADKAKTY
ncbi:unnamed protein product [Phytophthora lilii]|uniref:Unnamed protein product n=1 Tax=Phytophthora lilii TaxID=2077276 RepID=A0A9W6UA16_9STRA|nr:unnamed protein product [Phytophthora lilii]